MAFRRLYDGLSEGQQQFLKFSFVGGVGFGFGIVAGTAVGLIFNFTDSKYFVFRAREGDKA